MSHSVSTIVSLVILCAIALTPAIASAQLITHPDGFLDSIFPAGAQSGQTVRCELNGLNGLAGANRIVIEGPPGITVKDVQAKSSSTVEATFEISSNAPPGRRLIRVAGGPSGLTNCRSFFVSRLREVQESEPNNSSDKPCDVPAPCIINGRLEKPLDVDCFRFHGKKGQSIVAAVTAHAIDSIVRKSFVLGYLDTGLELLNESGQILAAAEDSVGLDPVLHLTLPADGKYILRIKGVGYQGAASAVYRLSLGEIPFITSIYPRGGKRGDTIDVELTGINVPPNSKRKVTIDSDPFLLQDFVCEESAQCLPLIRSDLPESREQEPNQSGRQANSLAVGSTVNGRFETDGDEDWYTVTLEKGQSVVFHTLAQRHVRAPVDTNLRILDEAGKQLAENDDGSLYMGQAWHDFESADSRQTFAAPATGRYFVCVSNNSGVYGPESVYRLTVEPWGPDFCLFQWPDAMPIWGPGSTSTCMAQVFTWGLESDVEIRVEGLPAGWQSGVTSLPLEYFRPYQNTYLGGQAIITITAPADAPVGTIVPFRLVGRAIIDGKPVEHEAQTLTLYGNSHNDRMFLRHSRSCQAVIANPLDCRLETDIKQLTIMQGQAGEIPVRIIRNGEAKDIGVSVDGTTLAASTSWKVPIPVPASQSTVTIPFPLNPEWRPGSYTIVVSRSWAADIRSGRPGPCTPAIRLNILPKK